MRRVLFLFLLLVLLVSCGKKASTINTSSTNTPSEIAEEDGPQLLLNDPPLLALGDSITFGYNTKTYPSFLGNLLLHHVINLGEVGKTSDRGVKIISDAIKENHPTHVLILYGANDILNQVDPETTIKNLRTMLQLAKKNNVIPVLATLTPWYGSPYSDYQTAQEALNIRIRKLSGEENVLLNDLATYPWNASYFPDGIHPSTKGNRLIASQFFKLINP